MPKVTLNSGFTLDECIDLTVVQYTILIDNGDSYPRKQQRNEKAQEEDIELIHYRVGSRSSKRGGGG